MGYFKERWTENLFSDRILKWIVDIVLAVVTAVMVIWFFGKDITIEGNSMTPELEAGEVVLLNRLAYGIGTPKAGDVIAYETEGEKTVSVKRILAVPGDTVQIRDGVLYVNETQIKLYETQELIVYSGIAKEPLTLGEDAYFVMGDNWNNSEDSRYEEIGLIQKEQILGKVWLRAAPFARIGLVKNKG